MGDTQPYTIEIYVTASGRAPFRDWLRGLRDGQARARIRVRLDRLSLGNPGNAHALSGGYARWLAGPAVELVADHPGLGRVARLSAGLLPAAPQPQQACHG